MRRVSQLSHKNELTRGEQEAGTQIFSLALTHSLTHHNPPNSNVLRHLLLRYTSLAQFTTTELAPESTLRAWKNTSQ